MDQVFMGQFARSRIRSLGNGSSGLHRAIRLSSRAGRQTCRYRLISAGKCVIGGLAGEASPPPALLHCDALRIMVWEAGFRPVLAIWPMCF